MDSLRRDVPPVLVVSAFGDRVTGGGLFSAERSRVERIDRISSMGLASDGRRLARILRCTPEEALLTELVVYDERGVTGYLRVDDAAATHDVAWDGDTFAVVSPWHNAVRWFSAGGALVREVRYPGPVDSWHLNCITQHEGVWYATVFGDFGTARGWKRHAPGAPGRLVELETGRTIADGLRSPHTPRWVDGCWLVCNSEAHELVALDERSGRVVRRVACGSWTRGLAYDDDFFYVGGCHRRETEETYGSAEIVVIDRAGWEQVDRICVPALEIYDLLFVPQRLLAGLRRGFDVNPLRTSEFRQQRIFTELGVEEPRTLWPSGEPLPWHDFRCALACMMPARCEAGELLEVPVRITNRSNSFFASAPPSPVYASYKWLDPETGAYLSELRAHRSPLPRALFPGETLEMTMLVIAPPRPGAAVLRLTLMQEGVSWFDEQDRDNAIDVLVDLGQPQLAESRAPVVR